MPAEAQFEIVLVDDDEDGRFVTGRYLEKYFPRAQITTFSSAEDALTAMQSTWPKAIVTDYRLPGMSGIEFVRTIRARDAHVPVVVMSGMDPAEDEARTAGATAFVPTSRVKTLGPTLNELL